jgi:hypothetical protein
LAAKCGFARASARCSPASAIAPLALSLKAELAGNMAYDGAKKVSETSSSFSEEKEPKRLF